MPPEQQSVDADRIVNSGPRTSLLPLLWAICCTSSLDELRDWS
ncbi:hypothetical protein ACFWAY_43570 [Rhodococcus sp. NPDC059968]